MPIVDKATRLAKGFARKIGANATIDGMVANNVSKYSRLAKTSEEMHNAEAYIKAAQNVTGYKSKAELLSKVNGGTANMVKQGVKDYYSGMSGDGKKYLNKSIRRTLGTAAVVGAPIAIGAGMGKRDDIGGDPY